MKTWLVWQDSNNGEDTYESFICCAESEEDARCMYPHNEPKFFWKEGSWCYYYRNVLYRDDGSEWVEPDDVVVELLGESNKRFPQVLLAKFRPAFVEFTKYG